MSYDSAEDSTLRYVLRWSRWGCGVLVTLILYPPHCVMGHRDIATTQRYLDYAPNEREVEMVDRAFGGPVL